MLQVKLLAFEEGLSQVELAQRMGVHVNIINAVVNGRQRPYPKLVRGLADALGWEGDPAELFQEVPGDELH